MAELVKQWEDGTSLSVTYTGDGDGSATFSSDQNEGIDREMSVVFSGGGVSKERTVRQVGLRQPYITADGKVFMTSDGKVYGVLKQGGVVPPGPEPIETYTRITYIEATGEQYINTGYVLQEDDIIEMYYITTAATATDKAMFGVRDSDGHTFVTIYSNTCYARFGSDASSTVSNARQRYVIKLQKGKVDVDGATAAPSFVSMATSPLFLFACNNYNNGANMFGKFKSIGFKISKASGDVVMDLKPFKRDSDGKRGMLDMVSGMFFDNQGDGEDFLGGNEIRIPEGYELMDYLACNNDKVFDTGAYGNEQTYIEVLFRRTDTSGADYLFGCSSGARLTAYLTTSGYWRYNSGYATFNTTNKLLNYGNVTPGRTEVSGTARTFTVGGAFQTDFTIPVGGVKPSSGVASKTYQGHLYFFRMRHGDTYVSDLVPCKRLSDGAECVWDCVAQQFLESL